MNDVGELSEGRAINLMTGVLADIPVGLFLFTFGFSCKGLSTLNNHSHTYKTDCVKTGAGTTGRTRSGNYAYVLLTKPPLVVMENVMAALRGANFQQLKADMIAAGYKIVALTLNSAKCGFPQDRDRAYFV